MVDGPSVSRLDSAINSAIIGLPRRTNMRDRIESVLGAAIISGELAPDELVSVPTLAARFGVSSTPVREAMLNLKKRGLVVVEPNKGFRVTRLSQRDLEEIVQLRQIIEGGAMKLVEPVVIASQLERYNALLEEIHAAADQGDFVAFSRADAQFHLTLLRESANERLARAVEDLRGQTRMVGLVRLGVQAEMKISAREDRELIDLLLAGDSARAAEHLSSHIGRVLVWSAGVRGEP